MKIIYTLFFLVIALQEIWAQDLTPRKNSKGKYGYVHTDQQYVISPKYDMALPFVHGNAKIMVKGKWGLIDEKGNSIINPIYDYMGWTDDPFYAALKEGQIKETLISNGSYDYTIAYLKDHKWGLISTVDGSIILEAHYHALHFPKNKTAIVAMSSTKGAIYGLIDSKGKELIRPQFRHISPDDTNMEFVVGREERKKNGHYHTSFGVITANGSQIIPIQYNALRPSKEYYAVQDKAHLWHILDKKGNTKFVFNNIDDGYADIQTVQNDLLIAKKNGKWGMLNAKGKIKIPFDYKEINQKGFQYSLLPFTTWKKVDKEHNTLKEYHFEELSPISANYYKVKLGGKYGVINQNGKMIEAPKYDYLSTFENGMAMIKKDGKYAIIDTYFKKIIEDHDSLIIDSKGYVKALKITHGRQKWGLYDKNARLIIPFLYEDINVYKVYRFAVKQYGKWGYINARGAWTIKARFDKVGPFKKGRAVVVYGGKKGVIDIDGKWIAAPLYDNLEILTHDIVIYKKNTQKGLLDLYAKKETPFDKIIKLSNGLLKVQSHGKWGLLKFSGSYIIPPKYAYITNCMHDSLFTAYSDSKYSLYNIKGRKIIKEAYYKGMGIASEGLVAVKRDRSWGYIAFDGRKKISSRYGNAKPFREGIAAVKIGNTWGYITKLEHLIVTPKYQEALPFDNQHALVCYQKKWGFIDNNGKSIIETKYDSIVPCKQGWLSYRGKYVGFINSQMKEIIYPKYTEISFIKQYFLVKRAKKLGICLPSGKELIPAKYDYFFFDPLKDQFLLGEKMRRKLVNIKD